MYEFNYEDGKKQWDDSTQLLYQDTESLLYKI